MKNRVHLWAAVAAGLSILWMALMVWLSYSMLCDKDPIPAREWQQRENARQLMH